MNIITQKITHALEQSSLSSILRASGAFACAVLLSAVMVFPSETIALLLQCATFYQYAPAKIAFCFALVHRRNQIIALYRKYKKSSRKRTQGHTIEGIPTVELLDHLFEFESFKRDDIEAKFNIPRHRYTDLAQKLETLGVLQRGPNNSRVLNPEYTRADIAAILHGRNTSGQLAPVLRQKSPTSWTAGPTLAHLMDRLKNALTPSPSFTVRKISE